MTTDRKDAVEQDIDRTVQESDAKRQRLLQELTRFDQTLREVVRPTAGSDDEERPHRGWRLPWIA